MGAAHHDIIPRFLLLQVLVLQFQLGNMGLVMGQHLEDKKLVIPKIFNGIFNEIFPMGISMGITSS